MQYSLPLQAGSFYHIYNRGKHSDLFFEPKNYRYFLTLYGDYIYPIAETCAYCLLKNHFHFLVRIRETLLPQISEVWVAFSDDGFIGLTKAMLWRTMMTITAKHRSFDNYTQEIKNRALVYIGRAAILNANAPLILQWRRPGFD